jgi:hypothetical protein
LTTENDATTVRLAVIFSELSPRELVEKWAPDAEDVPEGSSMIIGVNRRKYLFLVRNGRWVRSTFKAWRGGDE